MTKFQERVDKMLRAMDGLLFVMPVRDSQTGAEMATIALRHPEDPRRSVPLGLLFKNPAEQDAAMKRYVPSGGGRVENSDYDPWLEEQYS